jgi:general secretion pathway protein K
VLSKFMKNERGIALLVTLAIITILITVALELNRKARSAVIVTAATRDRHTLLHMASSGIHAAMALLVKDKMSSATDSIQEAWADAEKMVELAGSIPFEDGSVIMNISDELGKISVNAVVEKPYHHEPNDRQLFLWERFLLHHISQNTPLEEIEPRTIINSLKDWLDTGDDDAITGLSGAESDYYQGLDPPYACRNGPIPHLDELVKVKGITPELLYGVEGRPGISNFLTVHGMAESGEKRSAFEGKININTAEVPVLAALLPLEYADLAQQIYDFRQEKAESIYRHDLTQPAWYKDIPGFSDIEIDAELITTSSDLFRIESVATLHEMKMTTTAVVQRERERKTGKWRCRVLRWVAE